MKLRPYQKECTGDIRLAKMRGCKRQLVVLPTAAGKTVIFSEMPKALNMRRPEKMLVLVQSDELCYQSVDKLQRSNPELKIGLEKAKYKSTWSDDIVVASVQTLLGTKMGADGQWDWSKRLRTLDPDLFVNIIVDEAHHVTANNYHGPLRYFGVMQSEPQHNNPDKFLLGVTATPNRTDNKGLESFFEKIVYARDIQTMIKDGWLAEPKGHRVETMVSLRDVGSRGGDYIDGQLSKCVNTPERNRLIVDKYLELGEGAPFIALTVDIQHTIDLTEAFRARGVSAYGIASKNPNKCEWLVTGDKERASVIERYNAGEFQGLVSCQALMEGFDAPRATVVLWCRPTKSGLLYTQGTGRVLRPYPAPELADTWEGWRKEYAIVIDFVDNHAAVGAALVALPTLFGLRGDFNMQGKGAVETVEEVEKLQAQKPSVNAALFTDLTSLRSVAEKIDLFAVPAVPAGIRGLTKFAWMTGASAGSYQLVVPDFGVLMIRETVLGDYEISRHNNGIRTMLGGAAHLAGAFRAADQQVPREAIIILKSDAEWRRLPVTPAQIGMLGELYPELRKPFRTRDEFQEDIMRRYDRGGVSALLAARDKRRREAV